MKILSIATVIWVVVGCQGDKPAPRPPPPAPVTNGVQLISAGSEPRRVVQYHLAKGATSLVELALDVDIDAGGQGGPLPTLVMTCEIGVEQVLPDGSAKMRTTIIDVAARDRPGSPVSADQMSDQTQLMRGLAIHGTLSPDGALREMKVEAVDKLPPGLISQLDTLSRSFEQVAMPLPKSPIGAGAQWLYTKKIDQSGLAMTTATTFTLIALDSDTLTFQSTTDISGKDQSVTQDQTTVDLKKIKGSGTGKGSVDLTHMVMTGELTAQFTADMNAQGENSAMGMKTVTRVGPGKPRPAPIAIPVEETGSGAAAGAGSATGAAVNSGSAAAAGAGSAK